MTLRAKTLTSLFLGLIALVVSVYLVYRFFMIDLFLNQEEIHALDHVQEVYSLFMEEQEELDEFGRKAAELGAIRALTTGKPVSSIEAEVPHMLALAGRLAVLGVLSPDGAVLFSRPGAEDVSTGEPLLEEVPLSLLERLTRRATEEDGVKGFLRAGDVLYFAAAYPIPRNEDANEVAGVLLLARRVSRSELSRVSQAEGIRTALSLDTASAGVPREGSGVPFIAAASPGEDAVLCRVAIEDVFGAHVANLDLTFSRAWSRQGRRTGFYIDAVILSVAVAFGLVIAWIMERQVVRRVRRFSEEVSGITANLDPSRRVSVEGNDEVTALAESVNRMLGTLESSSNAMAASEAKWRRLFEHLPGGTLVARRDGKVQAVNAALCELTGFRHDDVVGMHCSVVCPRAGTENLAWLDATGPQSAEGWLKTRDGRRVPVLRSTVDVAVGDEVIVVANFLDMTALRRTEQELQDAQEAFWNALERLPFGVMLVDKQFRVRRMNEAGLRIAKYPSEDSIVGQSCHDTVSPSERGACPICDAGLDAEQSERILVTRDGEHVPILKSAVPIRFMDEEMLLEAFIDISDLKKARAEQTRLAVAIEQSTEAVGIAGRSGRVQYVNPAFARLTGYAREEITGRHIASLHRDDDGGGAQVSTAIANGERWSGRLQASCRDGGSRPVLVAVTPVLDTQGNVFSFVVLEHEQPHDVQPASHLRQAQKMEALGALASGIAHDFNNVLSPILGFAEIITGTLEEGTQAHAAVEEVTKAAQRAKALVGQILAFSRSKEPSRRPVSVASTVQDALAMIRGALPSTIEMETDIQATGAALANPIQLDQVLMNVCTNAAHAMKDNRGVLRVSVTDVSPSQARAASVPGLRPRAYVRISVADTGCGMDPETAAKAFEPFFTTKSEGEGTGMGLATVHGIITSHEGAVGLESELGKGTTIHIYLPRSDESAPEPAAEPESERGGTERVLFVDDEQPIIELANVGLRALGYDVECSTSAEKALRLFKSQPNRFDVVITDQTMPGMTGVELARALEEIRPGIPVILSSGYSEPAADASQTARSIREFALKPLSCGELAVLIRKVLDN